MNSCSTRAFIKKSNKKQLEGAPEEIKEEDWEVDSDELNQSFDSDDEAEQPAAMMERKSTLSK